MPSSFTPLGVEKMVTGEKSGQWGTLTNANWNLIEQIASGYKVQTLNAAGTGVNTTTLPVVDGGTGATLATRVIILGAVSAQAITGNKTVTIPLDVENWYFIKNSTSGSFTVEFKYVSGSGSSVTWTAAKKDWKVIYAAGDDGTNPNIVEVPLGMTNIVDDTSPQLGGDLDTNGFDITSASDADVDIIPNGTGDVNLGADTVQVGDNDANATITTQGTGDLILNTNNGTNAGNITLADGANGDITVTPNGTGDFVVAGTSTQAGKIVMGADTDDSGSFVASFQPGVLTESTAYTLPLAFAGTSGDVLASTDAGVLSWTTVSGGTSWQSVVTGTTQTAVAGNGYPINTTANVCTVTLPAGTVGDEVSLLDYARTFDSNNLTVASDSSEKIYGSTDDLTVSVEGASFTLVYVDATQGWLLKDN
jgi:hypothetical protein